MEKWGNIEWEKTAEKLYIKSGIEKEGGGDENSKPRLWVEEGKRHEKEQNRVGVGGMGRSMNKNTRDPSKR